MLSLAVLTIALANPWTHVQDGEIWAPNAGMLAVAQTSLESKVRHEARIRRLDLPKWSSYEFQYQGRFHDGQRVIFVSAFCYLPEEHSRDDFVVMSDGGTCFFEAKFDPVRGLFTTVVFHGTG